MNRRRAALVAVLLLAGAGPVDAAPAGLEAIIRRAEASGGRVGLSVVAAGEPAFAWRADERFPTASVAKVVTAAAFLAELHPEGTLETAVMATGAISAGALAGDLVIVGGGDPYLVTERLFLLAREVKAAGISRVAGKIVLVEDRFAGGPFPASWPEDSGHEAYQPAISALGINFNLAGVRVTPGARKGAEAVLAAEPGVTVRGTVTTSAEGSAPALTVAVGADGLRLTGSVPAGCGASAVRRRPGDYHPIAARAVKEIFGAAGIAVGNVVWGAAPAEARPLAVFPSLPAKTLTPLFLCYSNNFMAEVILRELGARRGGLPGTTEKGVTAALDILAARGFPTAGLALADGSGLSRRSQATPAAIATLLAAAAADWEIGETFAASLPLAGVEGTMEGRFPEERYERRIRAKTGSINGIRSLAGFVRDAGGRRLAFCLITEAAKEGFDARGTERAVMDALLGEEGR